METPPSSPAARSAGTLGQRSSPAPVNSRSSAAEGHSSTGRSSTATRSAEVLKALASPDSVDQIRLGTEWSFSNARLEQEKSPALFSGMRSLIGGALPGSPSAYGMQYKNNCLLSPPRMERSPGSPAGGQMAFELLTKGEEQIVQIPLDTILMKVVKSLPAKGKTVFECNKIGPAAFQSFVQFDVSGTRFSVGQNVGVARVQGEICASQPLAKTSAILSAFDYLEKYHFIYVEDYSSKVVENYEDDDVYTEVNSALYLMDKVLAKWSFAIDNISKFCDELEKQESNARADGCKRECVAIYSEALNFVRCFLTMYTGKHGATNLDFKQCKAERQRYMEKSDEKTRNYVNKGIRETICFTERDVLDYVISYLGLGIPKYSNEAINGSMFIGEVKLALSKIEAGRCGGRTKFHGDYLLSASSAEEDAAGKALRFLETKLKVSVTDKNYAERLEAKEMHLSHNCLLLKIVHLAGSVKIEWSNMLDCMKSGLDSYADEENEFSSKPLSNDQTIALKFCSSGMLSIHDSSLEHFKGASVHIKEIENYRHRAAFVEEN